VENLIDEAHDAPPEHFFRVFIKMHSELIDNRRAALANESASIIALELQMLLPLQLFAVKLGEA
jgi:hypothetical protein